MTRIKEFLAHPIIQMALVLGAVTILLAIYSKRVAAEPLRNWELALPGFCGTLFQGFSQSRRSSPFSRTWIGLVIVALMAGLVMVLNRP
ncbi:MAG: hypothetical protein ABIK96_13975 [bacterium]